MHKLFNKSTITKGSLMEKPLIIFIPYSIGNQDRVTTRDEQNGPAGV